MRKKRERIDRMKRPRKHKPEGERAEEKKGREERKERKGKERKGRKEEIKNNTSKHKRGCPAVAGTPFSFRCVPRHESPAVTDRTGPG